MSTKLEQNLNAIRLDKDTNLLPENLKVGVTCLGVTGTLNAGALTEQEYDHAIDTAELILGTSNTCTLSFIDDEENVVLVNNLTITKNNVEYNYTINNDNTVTAILPNGVYTIMCIYDNRNINRQIMVSASATEFELSVELYSTLTYLQSDGNQYIDTGVHATNGMKIEIQYMFNGTGYDIFGTRNVVSSTNVDGLFLSMWQNGYFCWGSQEHVSSVSGNSGLCTLIVNGPTWTINNNTGYTFNTETFETTYSMYLFAENTTGSVAYKSSARIYYFKVYDENDDLIQYLIPVKRKSDNMLCMYDLITETFFENLGSGSFTGQ